jgi:hypothetical protein
VLWKLSQVLSLVDRVSTATWIGKTNLVSFAHDSNHENSVTNTVSNIKCEEKKRRAPIVSSPECRMRRGSRL